MRQPFYRICTLVSVRLCARKKRKNSPQGVSIFSKQLAEGTLLHYDLTISTYLRQQLVFYFVRPIVSLLSWHSVGVCLHLKTQGKVWQKSSDSRPAPKPWRHIFTLYVSYVGRAVLAPLWGYLFLHWHIFFVTIYSTFLPCYNTFGG